MKESRGRIFIAGLILLCLGTVMVYSASAIFAMDKLGDSAYYLKRHLFYILIGLIGGAFCMKIEYYRLKPYAKVLLLSSIILLVLVLIPGIGSRIGGARRWFRIGTLGLQPSEFLKLALIVYLADLLSRKRVVEGYLIIKFLPALLVLGFCSGLILLEPDLGTAVAVAVIGVTLVFVAGLDLRYLAGLALLSLPALYILVFHVGYRKKRILAFLNPWLDPKGAGFQIIQSMIAFGTGGLFGVGLGQSKQKLFYLPQMSTDFIFSIIGEELGLLGAIGVIVLFAILVFEGMKVALRCRELFGFYIATGITTLFAFEAIVNMGVSLGAFPTKGLPLPLVSYGGSSLIAHIMAIALLLNISKHTGTLPP